MIVGTSYLTWQCGDCSFGGVPQHGAGRTQYEKNEKVPQSLQAIGDFFSFIARFRPSNLND